MASTNDNSGNSGNSDLTKFVSKSTLRRLISDIKELREHPLTAHGIYYEHSDDDILKGKALIIGPTGTPYENGFYLFKFEFPANYPHAPPVVQFCTHDGQTRFNPNLYKSGKVCLSILNTWQGEAWSGCQTISSILLAICTVFNDTPLLNEPGITKQHIDYDKYNEIITYKNIEIGILDILQNKLIQKDFSIFFDIMINHFKLKRNEIEKKLEELAFSKKPSTVMTSLYKLHVNINYNNLYDQCRFFKF